MRGKQSRGLDKLTLRQQNTYVQQTAEYMRREKGKTGNVFLVIVIIRKLCGLIQRENVETKKHRKMTLRNINIWRVESPGMKVKK